MRTRTVAAVFAGLLLAPLDRAEDGAATPDRKAEKGTVRFEPLGDQKNVPERYRLAAHTFDFEMERKKVLTDSGIEIWHVRFPSPVTSPHAENNTVHGEYYRPLG